MKIIGYDERQVLVCPFCRAVIQFKPYEIKVREEGLKREYGPLPADYGLKCPGCGDYVPEAYCRRVVYKNELNPDALYDAIKNDKVVVI